MHKTNCPVKQDVLTYSVLLDGTADVWIRENQVEVEKEEGISFEADEVYFKVTASNVPEEEIKNDSAFWFKKMSEHEDGAYGDMYAIEKYRANKEQMISDACESRIYAGTDIELSEGTEHFSLTEKDQLNLFGKQVQLSTGAKKLEYHQDGNPCHYYSAADMQAIIEKATFYVSFHTTYCNSMYTWLRSCKKASEMEDIVYGAQIPEEYQSEVFKDYLALATA